MKSDMFFRAIGEIDDALIAEAAELQPRRIPRWVRPAGGVAACLICAAVIALALPRLAGLDGAAEMAPDCAAPMENEAYHYSADMAETAAETTASSLWTDGAADAVKPGSTGSAVNPGASMVPPASEKTESPDTGAGEVRKSYTFRFYQNGAWSTQTKAYPDGLPDMQTLLSDYLRAAGTDVRCTGYRLETVGEKDDILPGGIVQHTVGVTTRYITLSGDPGDDILRGLTNTALDNTKASPLHQVQISMPARTFGPHTAFE